MILLISISFPIPFLSFYSFTLSFYRVLYNLYLNPNLLKILLNYTFTIPKVTTLHTYILTSCLIFFTHFLPFFTPFSILLHTFLFPLFFLYAFLSYFLTFLTHCLTVPKLILLYLVISYYHFELLYSVTFLSIGSFYELLYNSALLCHYCAIADHPLICILL